MASRRAGAPVARGPIDNRTAIVRAAAASIARSGVRGLKVEAVAEEAGVSPALLYYHFDNREGLVRAALELASDEAPSTALRRRPAGRSGYEALERALLGELDDRRVVREAAIVWGEISASAVFDPELQPDVRRVTEQWRDEVAETIASGIEDGSIRTGLEPANAADLLISLVDGLCTRWLAGAIDRKRARRLLREALRASLRR